MKKSRSEHLNIMTTPPVDAGLRAFALHDDTTVTVIVRRALEKAFADDPVFQAIMAYTKSIPKEEQEKNKLQMQNTSIPPEDRIPTEIKRIIKELSNE